MKKRRKGISWDCEKNQLFNLNRLENSWKQFRHKKNGWDLCGMFVCEGKGCAREEAMT